jgi:hypothetical protein
MSTNKQSNIFIYTRNGKKIEIGNKPTIRSYSSNPLLETQVENFITTVINTNVCEPKPQIIPEDSIFEISNISDLEEHNNIPIFQNPKKINMDYINHTRIENYHRAGWDFVLNSLQHFNDPTSDLIFDDYLDATFLWEQEKFKNENKIPFTKTWFGVLHHPPAVDYSELNIYTILNNPLFQQSLSLCKGLIVLSNYLKKIVRQKLLQLGHNIPIYLLYHPTLFVDKLFRPSLFNNNPNKMIIQIGGWLRDSYAIYKLYAMNINKAALKGLGMDTYFKPPTYNFKKSALFEYLIGLKAPPIICGLIIDYFDFDSDDDDFDVFNFFKSKNKKKKLNQNISGNNGTTIDDQNFEKLTKIKNYNQLINVLNDITNDTPIISNKYVAGLAKALDYNDKSVQIMNYISDDQYDILLQNNIVFLNLVDASACNTVIECIVRNTIIIINKLDAIVEVLGEDYPLYYRTIEEASILVYRLLNDKNLLADAYYYLAYKLDKTKLKIGTFVTEFNTILHLL